MATDKCPSILNHRWTQINTDAEKDLSLSVFICGKMFDDDRRFIIQFSVCHQLLRLTHDFELLGDRRAKACLTQSRRDAEICVVNSAPLRLCVILTAASARPFDSVKVGQAVPD